MITSIGPDSSMNPKVCAYPFVENCFSPYPPRPNTRGRTRIKQLRICVASPLDTPKLKQFALTSNSLAGASRHDGNRCQRNCQDQKNWAKEFLGLAASGADLKVWARLFLAGRLTGSITCALKSIPVHPFRSRIQFFVLKSKK